MDESSKSVLAGEPTPRLRFGLRSLFAAMAGVAMVLVAARWLGVVSVVVLSLFAWPIALRRNRGARLLSAMKCCAAYLALSIVTLPFLDSIWFGELPVLAIPQIPKVELARELQDVIIENVMEPLGFSRGSRSPVLIASKSWALGLSYAMPIGGLIVAAAWQTRMSRRFWCAAAGLIALSTVDFVAMHRFASGPGLTIF